MEHELLYRYLKGETTTAEERRIGAWLEADPEHNRRRLDSVRFLFEANELHGAQIRAERRSLRTA